MCLLMLNRTNSLVMFRYGALSPTISCWVCSWLGVMGTMYLEDVMSRVPRSPHSLQALLLSTQELIRRTKVTICSVAATAFRRRLRQALWYSFCGSSRPLSHQWSGDSASRRRFLVAALSCKSCWFSGVSDLCCCRPWVICIIAS